MLLDESYTEADATDALLSGEGGETIRRAVDAASSTQQDD